MLFRQLFDRVSCTYTYLLADENTKEAIIIDPVRENVAQYIQFSNELGLKLLITLDTHVHADHITGSGLLNKATDCKIVMGEKSKAKPLTVKLKDKEELQIGKFKLIALYTPGHTDDSYSYLTDDRVFTGDTLLIRGTGRTDFQNGSTEQQYHSIFDTLFHLPDEILVYPAHDYKGMLVSTIGEEKKFNPRLQVSSLEEYVKIMNNLNLAKPTMMDIAIPANLKCGFATR